MPDANSNEDAMMDLNLNSLDGEAYLQIARDVERFEQAWSEGAPFPLEDLVQDRPEALHGELLRHALIVELAYRRDRGETPTIGSYDWRFPLHVHVIERAFADGVSPRVAIPPPVPAPRPSLAKLGKYIVLRPLGDGGQGSAFLARDPDLGRQVVLKRYHSGASAAALKDGEALCRIRSRYIPQCFGMERDGDQLYVVMEYIPGRSLAEVRSETPPKLDMAARWIEQVAEGLEAVHARGLLHRDLKPSNIVIGDDQLPRLVDFGTAAHLGSPALQGISGTAPYMAPEQARNDYVNIDFRTDVYGLGATLYHLLTGIPPHPGASTSASLEHAERGVVTAPRELNPKVPRPLERIVLKALAAEPAQRYATAAEFRAALRRYRHRYRYRAATCLAGVLLLAALSFPVWLGLVRGRYSRPEGPTPPPAPLTGAVNVLIWEPGNSSRQRLALGEPGAMPLKAGDQIRVEARVNRPAYLYLVWIDSDGEPQPVYPWRPGDWNHHPAAEQRVRHVSLPSNEGNGWPMKPGGAGMETLLLLARESPLPPGVDMKSLLANLPRSSFQDLRSLVWFDDWALVQDEAANHAATGSHTRGPSFFEVEVNDPLLKAQALLKERLARYFTMMRAVSFANQGG
jgi:hypothetical protein